MKRKTFVVTNRFGLPMRSAAALIHTVRTFRSEARVEKDGERKDGRKIVDLLTLPAPHDSEITVAVQGDDEDTVMRRISEVMKVSPFVGRH